VESQNAVTGDSSKPRRARRIAFLSIL